MIMSIKTLTIIVFIIAGTQHTLVAQSKDEKNNSRTCVSVDLTNYGPQLRVAYDYNTRKGKRIGFSIAQVGGINNIPGDPTIYLSTEEIRINISGRYTNYLFKNKWLNIFGIAQAGISYNTVWTGDKLILPSFRVGMGSDVIIYKNSGIRLEWGLGSPYVMSAGYFFNLN